MPSGSVAMADLPSSCIASMVAIRPSPNCICIPTGLATLPSNQSLPLWMVSCIRAFISASLCSAVLTSPSDSMPSTAVGDTIFFSPVAGSYMMTLLLLASASMPLPSSFITMSPSTMYTCLPLPSLSLSLSVARCMEPSLCVICFSSSLSNAA